MRIPSSIQRMLLLVLSILMIASSDNGDSNCLFYDEVFQEVCQRCKVGFILDLMQTSCVQINQSEEKQFSNCLQISNFRECIRCDCGYVLEGINNICMTASSILIGCETSLGENICTRPKEGYVLVKGNQQSQMQVMFANGSHCEILDFQNGSCLQCHAGYRLDSEQNCKRISKKIVNQFFSFFSSDGEIHSRSIHFIVFSNGIYPKINDCEAYQQNYLNSNTNNSLVLCQQCSIGKSLNASRTACLKQPFEQCKIVSDSDHSLCEECIDNENFYLSMKDAHPQGQVCLPRRQLDPTTRCLEYQEHSSQCKKCSNGLDLTIAGCNQKQLSSKEQDLRDYSDFSYLNMKSRDPNCAFWISLSVCGSCIPGMVFNTQGQCEWNSIPGCIVPNHKGGCYQCKSLLYYNEVSLECIDIELSTRCKKSSGISNKCDVCVDLNNLNFRDDVCSSQKVKSCSQNFEDNDSTCRLCLNMFYLNSSNECTELTNRENCILNDGIHDSCLKCRKHFVLNDASQCILQTSAENGICIDLLQYYFDETTQNCQKRTSNQPDFCQKFDPSENRCLQCQEGYYIFSNGCTEIGNCAYSDGIHDQCYLTNSEQLFIDEQGKPKLIDKQCLTNKLENTCVSCTLESANTIKGNYGAILVTKSADNTFSYSCMSSSLIEQHYLFGVCYQFEKNYQTDQFQCHFCKNLYYLDENSNCLPMLQQGCLVSDGRSNKCIFCKHTYSLDQETKTCKINTLELIPFCKKYQENECILCKSLFYKFQKFCIPISDPDCEESDGLNNNCQKCQNGYKLGEHWSLSLFELVLCVQIQQISDYIRELSGIYNKHTTQRIQQLIVYAEPHLWNSKKQHCNLFHPLQLNCLACESGYYLKSIHILGIICLKNNIPNCKDQSESQCIQCESDYFLINGRCINLEECQSVEENVCTKCSDKSVLWEGQCILLENCEEQYQETCLRCRSGYFVFHKQNSDSGVKGYDYTNYFQWILQRKYDYRSSEIGPSRGNSTLSVDSCVKLPHCQESDGISDSCLRCDHGFKLTKSICVRNSEFSLSQLQDYLTPHCQDFSKELICLRCQNLYYLQDHKCIEINKEIHTCQESNGVTYSCNMCSFRGYELTEDETCRYIDNCEISNGLNWCILCKESHVVNMQGRCQSIIQQIENCEIYFSLDNQETTSAQVQGCQSCLPLYYVDTSSLFSQCIRLPDLQLSHCFFSEGVLSQCSVCQPGYFLKISKINSYEPCSPSKKFIRAFNFGCQIMNFEVNTCLQCYDRFFLGIDNFCYHRSIAQKCAEFHRNKDECLLCKSGYSLKKITENYQEKKICLELEVTERVIDCAEYYPNTNRCKKCLKRLKQDVVEFFLNATKNTCEDVLHLMCRKVKIVEDKKVCLQGYIENCLKYQQQGNKENTEESVSECVECEDGYYLHLDLETKNSSCKKHQVIRNCLIYSKQIPDTCEQCEDMFFLIKDQTNQQNACFPISKPVNCKTNEAKSDRCSLCNSGFAVNQIDGECVESRIRNCQILKQYRNQTDECVKCKNNFHVSENGMECLLGFKEQNNCKVIDSRGLCDQCMEGFIVLNEGDYCMPRDQSMLCQIEHCSIYNNRSSPDSMICQECQQGYFLDSAKKCRLDDETNFNKTEMHQQNQEGEEQDKQKYTEDDSGNFFILQIIIHIIITLLVVLIVFFLVRLRQKIKKMIALRSYEKENKMKQIAEKSEVIKTGQSIEIEFINETTRSLSQISYQEN